MSDYDQNKDQDANEQFINDLYSELSQELPSSALDEKILSAARISAEQSSAAEENDVIDFASRRKGAGPFSGNWTVPASLAAVFILSVTVVVMIEKERPYAISSPPEVSLSVDKESKPSDIEDKSEGIGADLRNKQLRSSPVETEKEDSERLQMLRGEEVMALRQAMKPPTSPEPQVKLAKSKVLLRKETAPSQQISSVTSVPDTKENAQTKGTGVPLEVSRMSDEVSARMTAPEAKQEINVPQSAKPVARLPAPVRPVQPAETAPEEFTIENSRQKSMVQSENIAESASTGTIDNSGSGEKKRIQTSEAGKLEVDNGNSAMSSPGKAASVASSPGVNFAAAISENTDIENPQPESCSKLSAESCLVSKLCTLDQKVSDGTYYCRDAENQCEKDFAQGVDSPEFCQSRAGCQYQAARCFCPPGVTCVCGGGAPAKCVPADK